MDTVEMCKIQKTLVNELCAVDAVSFFYIKLDKQRVSTVSETNTEFKGAEENIQFHLIMRDFVICTVFRTFSQMELSKKLLT